MHSGGFHADPYDKVFGHLRLHVYIYPGKERFCMYPVNRYDNFRDGRLFAQDLKHDPILGKGTESTGGKGNSSQLNWRLFESDRPMYTVGEDDVEAGNADGGDEDQESDQRKLPYRSPTKKERGLQAREREVTLYNKRKEAAAKQEAGIREGAAGEKETAELCQKLQERDTPSAILGVEELEVLEEGWELDNTVVDQKMPAKRSKRKRSD